MENFRHHPLPEVLFGSSDKTISKKLARLEKLVKIRKIAPRIYTSNFEDSATEIIRRNWMLVLSNLYPGALLSHRSAFEFSPTKTRHIFITYTYTRKIEIPGLIIQILAGPGPVEGDNILKGELFVSQQARAFLENLQTSRKTGPGSKTISLPQMEEKLALIIRTNGEAALNEIRDNAREIALKTGMEKEYEQLNKLIGALLSTQPSTFLTSPLALARAIGNPYDSTRLLLFETLFAELNKKEFPERKERNSSMKAYRNFAFFESYFSNYIEGTVFEIDEAKDIIAHNRPMPARNDDSHDILGTYHLVSRKNEMTKVPGSAEELLNILQYRHGVLLSTRKSKNPGHFKDKNNRAGNTQFVDFNLVRGTLIQSFDLYRALRNPFSKAVFIMFVVSEVHPFLDGNGRIARVMMNTELTKENQSKIIIPTVYREDYMGALRKLTRQSAPDPFIRMMQRAHEFSENIYGEDMDEMQEYLQSCTAFLEPGEGKLHI